LEQMRGVVKTRRGVGNVELLVVPDPVIGDEDVLVQVVSAGICGTDIGIYSDAGTYLPPVVLGHEYSGRIVRLGAGVQGLSVGDRVTSAATIPCGECHLCKTGSPNRCVGPNKRVLGSLRADGAFAEYVAVPASLVHRIPDALSFDEAALVEPAACVVHAVVERVGVGLGETVVVLGPGPIGLLAVQVARAQGAGRTIVAGLSADKERLAVAKRLGADVAVNIEDEDLSVLVRELTGGLGADLVLEASGSTRARAQALELVRRRGRVGLIGLAGGLGELDVDKIVEGELDVQGSWGTVWSSWRGALAMMCAGRLQVLPLISRRLTLEEWKRGFDLMIEKKAIKVLLTP